MAAFRHPAFARLAPKINRATRELREVERFLSRHDSEMSSGEWGALSAVSLGIHNIYNGIEDILLSLAKDIDGLVPSGPTAHQDILDQMSVEIAGIRPALLTSALYEALTELKGFRHRVRHRYGFDLRADKIQENLDRVRAFLQSFIDAVVTLKSVLIEEESGKGGD